MAASRNRPDSPKFPVFSLLNREIAGQTRETGSPQTARTANDIKGLCLCWRSPLCLAPDAGDGGPPPDQAQAEHPEDDTGRRRGRRDRRLGQA